MTVLRHALSLGMLVALAALVFTASPLGSQWRADVELAWLFGMRGARTPPQAVAVVAIDRESARALGQSAKPADWPRTLHARLIEALASAGARVVAFDLSFAAPARNADDDRRLAKAMQRAGNVVLLDFLEQLDDGGTAVHIARRLPPIPLLADVAAAHGPFALPKAGLVHAYWLYQPGARSVETLPVLALRVFDASAAPEQVAQRVLPGSDARYLDFYGPPRTISTVGFHEVLNAAERADAAWLRQTFSGRAVFVGYSAANPSEQDRVRDDYRTVFSRDDGLDISGVEIAATAFANLLEERDVRPLPGSLQLALLLGWGLLLGGICSALRGIYAAAAALGASAGFLALAHLRFAASAQWLPLAAPLLIQAPLALFGGLAWHYILERRERRRLRALIADLLPRVIVDNLLDRIRSVAPPERDLFGVFILTDIRGYTTIAESMEPQRTTQMLNDYFALIFPIVERNGGSISDIAGDAMLAFWVCSGPQETEARRAACRAALEIAASTRRPDALAGWPPLPTRIGVHGGPIRLARIGAANHYEYRAVGDAVNTVSRIEALSKLLGTQLLVAQDVVAGLDDVLVRPLGSFLLPGKNAPVRVCELLGLASDASDEQRRLCEAFDAALAAYRSRRWTEAVERWSAILTEFPDDGPSRFYRERASRQALEAPARDWDGTVRIASK